MNDSTEFILGSHKLGFADTKDCEHQQFVLDAGSALLFDGRILHRGRANQNGGTSRVIYQVFSRDWYTDY